MFEAITEAPHVIALMGLLTVALVNDVLFRRIPNTLVVAGLVAGLVTQVLTSGPYGLALAAGGAVVGFACLLPMYLSGGMGAGDVKLMAMCGAFLGPVHVAAAAIASLFIGGLIGVLWYFRQYFSAGNLPQSANAGSTLDEIRADGEKLSGAIPYALAICAGVMVALAAVPALRTALAGVL